MVDKCRSIGSRDWRRITLGEITENQGLRLGGGVAPVLSCTKYRGLVRSDEYFKNRQIYSDDISNYKVVKRNWLAYATNHLTEGSIGIQREYPLACVSPIYTVFSCRNCIDPEYMFLLLKSAHLLAAYLVHEQASVERRGAVRYSDFSKIHVDLPPLPQQNRIAKILSTVDEAIEQTEALITKTQQIKAGLMHDLFTRGVTADGQLRPPLKEAPQLYKESPLGWIPKEWDWDTAGNIASSIVPGRNKPTLDGGPFPWITITDIQNSKVISSEEELSVSAISIRSAGGRTVPAGTVIMSCVGEFGIVAIADCELVINQQLHGFVCSDRVHPGWLMHTLRMQKPFLDRIATQTTIKYLNKAGCESVPVLLPDPDEQAAMVDRLSSVETTIQTEQGVLRKLAATKAGLMHDLLTGAVSISAEMQADSEEVAANV